MIAGTVVGLSSIALIAVGALMDGVLGPFVSAWGVLVALVGVDVMRAHEEVDLPLAMVRRRLNAKKGK